jgi:hypothetical protein
VDGWAETYAAGNALASAVTFASAATLLALRGRPSIRFSLAACLVFVGLNTATWIIYWLDIEWATPTGQLWSVLTGFEWVLFDLLFVSYAIDVPLTRPIRTAFARGILLAIGIASIIPFAVDPYLMLIPNALHPRISSYTSLGLVVGQGSMIVGVVCALYSTAAAIQAVVKSSPGSRARARAAVYLRAFVFLDGGSLLAWLPIQFTVPPGDFLGAIVLPILLAIFTVLLVRAILRDHLFDFDLKVKWTIERGTVAAIILGAAFVVAQIAENFLAGQYGWLLGGAVAGVLLFAIRPIERFAERLAARAMPKTTGTPEYVAQRKEEIYRAALEDAMRGGSVSAKERQLLLRLAQNLQLSADTANEIEQRYLAGAVG